MEYNTRLAKGILQSGLFKVFHPEDGGSTCIIGEKIETFLENSPRHEVKDIYQNYLNLVNVFILCTSNYIDHNTPANVELLITHYLWGLWCLTPTMHFTPKCHYLQHVPEQLRRFEPSWGTWTLRFEAKHSEFKANKLVNFKNVPKTFRCHFMIAYEMLGSDGQKSNTFFYKGDEVEFENSADFEFVNTFGHLKREFELKVMARCKYDRNIDSWALLSKRLKQ